MLGNGEKDRKIYGLDHETLDSSEEMKEFEA